MTKHSSPKSRENTVRCERCHGHGVITQIIGRSRLDNRVIELPCICPVCAGYGAIKPPKASARI